MSGISEEELTPWVIGHFSKIRLDLPSEFVGHVVRHFECHPMYIQQFFSILWDHVHHPGFKFPAGDFIALVNKIELDMINAKRIDVELEILYKNDRYAFYDILFRKWLQKKIAF